MKIVTGFLFVIFASLASAHACQPGGRGTFDVGVPIMYRDVSSPTLWLMPTGSAGDRMPVWDGSEMQCQVFATNANGPAFDLTGLPASSSHDLYWSNDGLLCSVPWGSIPDGIKGGWKVNGSDIPACRTSSSATINCPQYQCTYILTFRISAIAGVAKCTFSAGLDRECGVWNFYNQAPLVLKITDPAAPYIVGSDGTNNGTNLRSALGCINRDCRFSATTLVGRIGDRFSAKMTYNVRGLHASPWQNVSNVAHETAWGLDRTGDNNPAICDAMGTINFEPALSVNFNTGISSFAFCDPTADQLVGVHTFYMMEYQLWGFGQAWISPDNLLGTVSGKF